MNDNVFFLSIVLGSIIAIGTSISIYRCIEAKETETMGKMGYVQKLEVNGGHVRTIWVKINDCNCVEQQQ